MAKTGGHVVHIPEDYSDKDQSRPYLARAPGQIGIYLEINDVEPVDAHAYGSHVYFLREMTEKFGTEIRKIPLDRIKGVFERKALLVDVIFEAHHASNIIVVSFESPHGLAEIKDLHDKELLTPIFQRMFVTDTLLKHLAAKYIKLDIRMWADEQDECKTEMEQSKVVPLTLADSERDREMIKKVKKYHGQLAEMLLKLKDALNKFDKSLGEFIMILKQNLPRDLEKITTYNEFIGHVKNIKKKRADINGKVLDEYTKALQCIKASITQVEEQLLHPLLQVHSSCETPYQQELKAKMRKGLREIKHIVQADYNFYNINHKDWQAKILLNEQRLFLGLISVLPKSVDTIVDIDGQTDEYMSVLTVKIKEK